MRGIIDLLLFIVAAYFVIKLVVFIFKRTVMLVRIFSLKKMCGARISLHSFPYRPMWMTTKKPDIRVEILDTVYLIRLYSGGGLTKNVHFASEEYSCICTQIKGALKVYRKVAGRTTPSITSGMNVASRVLVLPPLEVPEVEKLTGKHIERVLLMCPTPSAVSYVTEEKTSVQIAFTGDEVYGIKVFTASTFQRYADRQSRMIRPRKESEYDYFFSKSEEV